MNRRIEIRVLEPAVSRESYDTVDMMGTEAHTVWSCAITYWPARQQWVAHTAMGTDAWPTMQTCNDLETLLRPLAVNLEELFNRR